MTKHLTYSQDDVLNAFAMDFEPGERVLQRYISQYPQYSLKLVDLARELAREFDEDSPLDADDLAAVNAGMRKLQRASISLQTLQTAPAKKFTDAAKKLGLPIQVGLALRECRIDASTVPSRVIKKLSQALEAPIEVILAHLALPPNTSQLRASKSSTKPAAAEKVSIERILKDAGYSEDALSQFLNNE